MQKCNLGKSAGVICCSGAGSFHGKVGQICALHFEIIIIIVIIIIINIITTIFIITTTIISIT